MAFDNPQGHERTKRRQDIITLMDFLTRELFLSRTLGNRFDTIDSIDVRDNFVNFFYFHFFLENNGC